jgi:hypothetical protein
MKPSRSGFEKCLLLIFGQKPEKSRDRKQQHLRITVVKVGTGQKIRTDHLQTIPRELSVPSISAAVSSARSSGLPLSSLSTSLLNLSLAISGGFVQPSCIFELLPITARQFRELQALRPADFCQLAACLRRRIFVDRHQVISLRQDSGNRLVGSRQKISVSLNANTARQRYSQFDKVGISLVVLGLRPAKISCIIGWSVVQSSLPIFTCEPSRARRSRYRIVPYSHCGYENGYQRSQNRESDRA